MEITYDTVKSTKNFELRGISFEYASEFDFGNARIEIDSRKEYGETRYFALGLIRNRVHAIVFTQTKIGIRVISLRKANAREVKSYENYTQS